MRFIICNLGPGQATWLIGGNWKAQLFTTEDVAAWEAAGALVNNAMSAAYVNALPVV